MPAISKPHATWKPGVDEEEREKTWKEAAGPNKSHVQHIHARKFFTRNAKEDAAEGKVKNGVGLDDSDRAVLEKKETRRLNELASKSAWLAKPENKAKKAAGQHALRQNPEKRAKMYAATSSWKKTAADALHAERAADFKAKGDGVTTEFGLGDILREDEVKERVHDIMHSSAGVFQYMGKFEGGATCDNWVRDHGEYTSVEDVLATGEFAAYILTTMLKIVSGTEIKCRETTEFMTRCDRDPLWRLEDRTKKPQLFGRPGICQRPKHVNEEIDLRRFTVPEAKTVVRSYLLAKCVSSFDATSLEGGLQRYIEDMGMPHGMCLHQKAGAGSKLEYGITNPETTCVALSLIRVKSPKFADIEHSDAGRSPPLTSCTVTSHDGKTDYKVAVRGHKQKFPDTKSVLADKTTNAASRLQNLTRHRKRKAGVISTAVDEKLSE